MPERDGGSVAAALSDAPPAEAPGTSDSAVIMRSDARLLTVLKWSYILSTGGNLIAAILQIGVTAFIGPTSFGVMTLAMVWVTLALQLLSHGPTMAVIQQDDITNEHANTAFWANMVGSTLFTVAFAALAPLWALANHLPQLVPVCLALTPCILLTGFCSVLDALMRRRMEMRSIAVRTLASSLIGGLCGLAGAFAGWGVWALVIQQNLSAAVWTVMLWRITPWRPHLPRWQATVKAWRDIRESSVQTLAGSFGYFIASRVDSLIMGIFFTPIAVGLYRFAGRFAEMVVDLTSRGLQQVSLPDLARHNNEPGQLAARLGRLLHVGVVLSFPALAILAAVAQPFVVLLGDEWRDAVRPLQVLCAVSAVGVITSLLTPALQAAQRSEIPTIFTWVSACVYVIGFLAAVRLSGSERTVGQLTTVATVVLGLRILVTAVMMYVSYRHILRVSALPTLTAVTPTLLACLAAVLAGTGTEHFLNGTPAIIELLVSGAAASCAAGAVLLCLDPEVRRWAARGLRKLTTRGTAPDLAVQD
jgi:teichuronic acid exporter